MSKNINRRDALKLFSLGIGTFAVNGCQPASTTSIEVSSFGPRRTNNFHTGNYSRPSSSPYLPARHLDDTGRWRGIIVHHSATTYGDARTFDHIHRSNNGWDSLGYHFIINNGKNGSGLNDGQIEIGDRWQEQKHGAHCRPVGSHDNYWNEHTIGICLVGNFQQHNPSESQYQSLAKLVDVLRKHYNISSANIIGHKDVSGANTLCPGKNFSWNKFNQILRNYA